MQIQLHLRSEALLNQSVSEGRPGAKVYFGARIIPRPDKYYELELVSDPRGVDTVVTETNTTTICPGTGVCTPTGTNTTTTSSTRSTNEQKLAFSLQMARRFGPLTVRGGLIESSGGVGADLHLLDDSLRFSLSIFQFNRPNKEAYPRAKLWADYVFLKHLYLTTGVDDFLNRWSSRKRAGARPFNIGTDVFFGGGLEFTDDESEDAALVGRGLGRRQRGEVTRRSGGRPGPGRIPGGPARGEPARSRTAPTDMSSGRYNPAGMNRWLAARPPGRGGRGGGGDPGPGPRSRARAHLGRAATWRR